jgi:hypothetical protein
MVGDNVGRFFGQRRLSRERPTSQWREMGGGLAMYVRVFCAREIEERLWVMTVSRGGLRFGGYNLFGVTSLTGGGNN